VLLVLTLVFRVVAELVVVDVADGTVVVDEVCPALAVVVAAVVAAPPVPVTGVPDAVIAEVACVIEIAPLIRVGPGTT
jgi:hypothetical protein